MFTGVYTALITPFTADGTIDEGALRKIVEDQIDGGVDGLVPMGTTGESPTVTHEENLEVIRIVIEQAAGRVPVIAGTGSNSTSEAIDMTMKARDMGAAASLQVAPYYNKPSQEGFYRHFSAIGEATGLPVIIYNIPGRTGKNIEADTILRLAEHPQIVGVKEASGDLSQVMDIIHRRPEGFSLLSGDDNVTLPLMSVGAEGVVSVASNIIPGEMKELTTLAASANFGGARQVHYRLMPLFKAMFLDTNPIPVKYAMHLAGHCSDRYRLPLCEPTDTVKKQIEKTLKELKLL